MGDVSDASTVEGLGVHPAPSNSLMALKAESPLVDYIEVSSSVSRFKKKEKTVANPRRSARPFLKQDGNEAPTSPANRGARELASGASQEEPGISWRQEYLIADSSSQRRPICMVCGAVLPTSSPRAARQHILEQHPHSLDFSLDEKRNILEAWSEGAVLPEIGSPPSSGSPGKSKRPAEIEVLLDSEDRPVSRKRGLLQAHREELSSEPDQRIQLQQRLPSSGQAREKRSKEPGEASGKEWLSECGLPSSAPAEIRIFTDGSFPAGFTLKLYCRSQPEPSQGSEVKPNTKKRGVDRNCSVSLLRLHSQDTAGHLRQSPSALASPLGSSKNCKPPGTGRQSTLPGKEPSPLLVKGFNPVWRARFLVDVDAATGHLVCMVCEYPLRRVCLATVKQHILQCHAETLQMPREVRRTIREVWESRAQASTQATRK